MKVSRIKRKAELQTLPSRGTISQSLADRIAEEKTFKKRLVAITCQDGVHAELVAKYVHGWHGRGAGIDANQPVVYARIDSPLTFMLLQEEDVDIRERYHKNRIGVTDEVGRTVNRQYATGAGGMFWM